MYASSPYATTAYASILGGGSGDAISADIVEITLEVIDPAIISDSVDIDVTDLADSDDFIDGVFVLNLEFLPGNANSALVDVTDLEDSPNFLDGVFIIYLNKNSDGSDYEPVADSGELWKRVPRHSQSTFLP
jgi:hypothetical protein